MRDRLRVGTEFSLERYDISELVDIPKHRAQVGPTPGAVDRTQLECIADVVAGVARLGIQTLRRAAEIVTKADGNHIVDADLEARRVRADRAIRKANLRSLPCRYQFLYAAIQGTGDATVATDDSRPFREASRIRSDRERRQCPPAD